MSCRCYSCWCASRFHSMGETGSYSFECSNLNIRECFSKSIPNPVNSRLNIKMDNSTHFSVDVTDMPGKSGVRQNPERGALVVATESTPVGVYLIDAEGNTLKAKVVIKRSFFRFRFGALQKFFCNCFFDKIYLQLLYCGERHTRPAQGHRKLIPNPLYKHQIQAAIRVTDQGQGSNNAAYLSNSVSG